ncbi:hypothetical protein LTR70_001506 [Exophiala xenobiotica]|uniref:Uncharacterized protein n=1 Tax=Lithohypha guttulata TaxID=1690604 RepID=A0ABR0KH58_9EURO|nr:hypothetical protein LTR24_002796 [Lithohypha guttulata]KAK5327883.1 hypothetical protein LTR70_001506 [Exophiala xenobiotica]
MSCFTGQQSEHELTREQRKRRHDATNLTKPQSPTKRARTAATTDAVNDVLLPSALSIADILPRIRRSAYALGLLTVKYDDLETDVAYVERMVRESKAKDVEHCEAWDEVMQKNPTTFRGVVRTQALLSIYRCCRGRGSLNDSSLWIFRRLRFPYS